MDDINFWHIQLHPDDNKWNFEKKLLKEKQIIGIGDYWPKGEKQIKNFNNVMKVGDIVLVRHGSEPIALVKIIGKTEDLKSNKMDQIDWFRYRRKVEVLDWAKNKDKFPDTRGTLKIIKDKNSQSYKYIYNWYQSLFNESDFISHIYIKNYKVLKDINLDFTYKGKVLNIIILAGVNGSGKTSILEFINSLYQITYKKDKDSFVEINNKHINFYNEKREVILFDTGVTENKKIKEYKNNIEYLGVAENLNLDNVKKLLTNKINKEIFVYQKDIKEVYNDIKNFIHNVFENLDLMINFSYIDENDNIFFQNKSSETFNLEEISSGEKNLLIKVLYLYLKEIKNKVILIDEPELSLHPTWQSRILKLYENFVRQNNCQIIIATHSPHIIGSAKPEYLRVLTFDKNNNVIVLDNFNRSYGLEFEKVLLEIMGVKELRVPEIEEKINKLKQYIQNQNKKDFIKLYKELETILGDDDTDLQLIKMQANLKGLNV